MSPRDRERQLFLERVTAGTERGFGALARSSQPPARGPRGRGPADEVRRGSRGTWPPGGLPTGSRPPAPTGRVWRRRSGGRAPASRPCPWTAPRRPAGRHRPSETTARRWGRRSPGARGSGHGRWRRPSAGRTARPQSGRARRGSCSPSGGASSDRPSDDRLLPFAGRRARDSFLPRPAERAFSSSR